MADTATDLPDAAESDTATRKFPQSRFSPPPGATEILLVRHGESAPHVEGESFDLVDGTATLRSRRAAGSRRSWLRNA